MTLRNFYLVMAIVGAVVPYYFFFDMFAEQGVDLAAFVQGLFANGAAGGFSADLLISSFVFWAYMFARQDEGPKPWLFIALNLTIGLSCALPAYLWASASPARLTAQAAA